MKENFVDKNKFKSGSVHLIIIIVLVITMLSALGFAYWRNFIQPKESNTQSTNNNSTKVTASTKNYNLTPLSLSFLYPSDWSIQNTYPNGVTLGSSDFVSSTGFANISNGSIVSLSNTPKASTYIETDEVLRSYVFSEANGEPDSSEFIEVAGHRAIKFNHSSGENRNSHTAVIFIKDNQEYIIDQQYKLGSKNPYPELIDTIVLNLEFVN